MSHSRRASAPAAHPGRGFAVAGVALLVLALLVVLAAAWIGLRTLRAADDLTAARAGLADLRAQLTAGEVDAARAGLADVQAHTSAARSATSDPVFAVASAVPYLGNTPDAVSTVARAVNDLAQESLPEVLVAAQTLAPENLRLGGEQVNLAAFEQAQPGLDAAVSGITAARDDVAGLDLAGVPTAVTTAVTDLQDALQESLDAAEAGAVAARLVPPMLGAEGPRRYFLAFTSNAEARGTGGFLGSWGIVRAVDGKVTVERIEPRSVLDRQVYDTPPVDFGPDFAALYGEDPGSWANANLSPHFPYAAQLWLQMWQDRTGQRLDGAVATDPVAASYILEATGPTLLKGGEVVSADTIASQTMSEVYQRWPDDDTARDTYLEKVAEASVAKVLSGAGDPRDIIDALGRAAGERRMLLFSARPEEQAVIAGTAAAGLVEAGPGPFAGVAMLNGSGNKLDYYVEQELDYAVTGCSAEGERSTTVTVTLTNHAPRKGLPLYVEQRLDLPYGDDGLPQTRGGDTFGFAQVYVAEGADLVAATRDGEPLFVAAGREQGRPVFQVPVLMKVGAPTTLTFELREPAALESSPVRTFMTPLVKPTTVRADDTGCGAG